MVQTAAAAAIASTDAGQGNETIQIISATSADPNVVDRGFELDSTSDANKYAFNMSYLASYPSL